MRALQHYAKLLLSQKVTAISLLAEMIAAKATDVALAADSPSSDLLDGRPTIGLHVESSLQLNVLTELLRMASHLTSEQLERHISTSFHLPQTTQVLATPSSTETGSAAEVLKASSQPATLPTFIQQTLSAVLLLKLAQLVAHVHSKSLETRNAKLLLWQLLEDITDSLTNCNYEDVTTAAPAELEQIQCQLQLVVQLAVPAMRQAIKDADGQQGPACGRLLNVLLSGPLLSFQHVVATELISTGKSDLHLAQTLPAFCMFPLSHGLLQPASPQGLTWSSEFNMA